MQLIVSGDLLSSNFSSYIFIYRLLILGCPVILLMLSTISLKEAQYLSSGLPQKQCTTGSTLPPVMSGATGVCSMRYGA